MSQKTTRKTAVNEEKEKEKRQTDSPVKEMKKKMAANAEKEKQAAEKVEKAAEKATEKQTEKNTEKNADKPDKTAADKKTEKSTEKHTDSKKSEKSMEKISEKPAEKADKSVPDKKPDKNVEKKDPPAEKSKEDGNKEDKSGKSEISDQKKPDNKAKQNGREARAHNGVSDVTLSSNGVADDVLNGTVSADSEDDDVMLVIDDQDQDELFPELTYDDGSDVECFEPPTPESAPSRSFTRRSQVKSARTPETPRPASDKTADKLPDDPKDSKVLKLNEAPPTDRKLRSADSPKPESKKETKKPEKDSPKKQESATEKESPKKQESAPEKEAVVEIVQESEKKDSDNKSQEDSEKRDAVEMEVVIEVEADASEESRKPDTNYSKSRVKVSPYRRSMRIADQTNSSLLANYTGNNTTMEMDISETSSFMSEDAALDDSSYLRGLRSIRGRNSYKPLKDITLRHVSANRSARAAATASESQASGRPTGTVVGRKRKPELADAADVAEVNEPEAEARGKRMRLLERLAVPFRRNTTRNAEIVGINTDLPLTAPVASADSFDPETLKPIPVIPADAPVAVPLAPSHEDRDNKRCLIM